MKFLQIIDDTLNDDQKRHFIEISLGLSTTGFTGYVISHYNVIAGNLFLTLSILYLLWRWRRDYRKNKREEKDHGKL